MSKRLSAIANRHYNIIIIVRDDIIENISRSRNL